jgi:hypothetical protein
MFTVEFAEGVCLGYGRATAKAVTVRQAIAFVEAFAPGGCGVIPSDWIVRDGRRVMELFDWCDCWFTGPIPVLARIIAPPGEAAEQGLMAIREALNGRLPTCSGERRGRSTVLPRVWPSDRRRAVLGVLHGRARRPDRHRRGTAAVGGRVRRVRVRGRLPAGVRGLPALRVAAGRVGATAELRQKTWLKSRSLPPRLTVRRYGE